MGKVQNAFGYGSPGAITRSADDIVISVRNASDREIPFGAPVFLADSGAVPFNVSSPQDFETFLGFAVRVADKTPDSYPRGQFSEAPAGAWQAGDVMEVLVRGSIALAINQSGTKGGWIYIRKSDGRLTASAGASGTTVQLENVRIRNPKNDLSSCCEATVNKRNIL